jgi:hypothetical protein
VTIGKGRSGMDSGGYRAILQSDRIWDEHWLSTVVMVKILRDVDSRGRLCAREDCGGLRRIQSETTVRQNMGRTYLVVIWIGSRLLKLLRAATRFNAGNRRTFTTTKGKEVGDALVCW